jgi:hypothetical protein
MRLFFAALVFAAFWLAGLAAPAAQGAPATRETNRILFIGCTGMTAGGARAAMEVSTFESNLEVDARLFAPGAGEEDPPVISSDPGVSTGTATWEGSQIAGLVPVFDVATGAPLGDATFVLTFTAGEPETIDGRIRNGNQVIRESATFSPVTGTGTLTFPGGPTVALTDCAGVAGESTLFRNNPRAQISGTDVSQASCDLEGPDGRRLLLTLDASAYNLLEFAPGADPDVDPPLLFGAAEDAVFTRRSLTVTAPLFAAPDGEPVFVGDAIVQAKVVAAAPTTRFERVHRSHLRIRTWPLTFVGTITMPDGRQYDMAGCTGHREVIQVQSVP